MLEGKVGVVFGLANQHSLAWHITKALAEAGANLAITYQNERFESKIKKLIAGHLQEPPPLLLPCNVLDDREIENVYREIGQRFNKLDFIVHSIAFALREDLKRFLYHIAQRFSNSNGSKRLFTDRCCPSAIPLMKEGGSIVTLTYLGSQRVVPNYNIMGVAKAALESSVRYLAYDLGKKGIRVNALSPGPVNTLSARGIKGFTGFLADVREHTPLQKNTEGSEVGDAALFLCSDLSRGITGETIFVDSGYHIKGY